MIIDLNQIVSSMKKILAEQSGVLESELQFCCVASLDIFSKLPLDCYLYNLHFQNVFSCVVFPRAIIFFFFMKMVLNQAISIKNHKESLFELTPNNWRKLRIYSNTNLFFHKMVFLFHSTSAAPFSVVFITFSLF